MMLRVLGRALGASFAWWLAILVGSTVGGAIGFFVSPLGGRILGGLVAGLIAGAIEARVTPEARGKRLRFTAATALATSLATVLLLGVAELPWLVGAVFGTVLAMAQGQALSLGRRDVVLRGLASSSAWALGFLLLHHGGLSGKIGALAPGLAVVLLAIATAPRRGQLAVA